ncbi:MAG TPA: cation-transporting P-type ATPase [Ruminococcus sp.]|nr:cation-transporting P-type ATPase [Ruminococcus sp.]
MLGKTGTITENKMTVTELAAADESYYFSGMGYRISGGVTKGDEGTAINPINEKALTESLICGVICSDASITAPSGTKSRNRGAVTGKGEWKVTGDPTEAALLIAASKAGITKASLENERRRLDEFPFDSENRFMAVHCICGSGRRMYFKGAEEVLLPRCSMYMAENGEMLPLTPAVRSRISAKMIEMSDKALRVLALAYCDSDTFDPHRGGLVFLGLTGMIDPPREEARTAIRKCASASVKTVMITGDHKNTAVAVARKAGLLKGGKAMTGEELDRLSDEELDRIIGKYTVFARVEPVHKLRIVRSFKRRGEIVTMTGDGVNDAPAIKEADVGVAMGVTGTDVTKQAADVILLDDNLATLVNAVEQGRCVYANIRKFVRYLLSCNIGEVLTMFLGILMGMPMVLLPVQILLVNLVTDGLPAVALGMDPPEKEIMSRPPRCSTEGFFSGGLMGMIVFRGIFIGLCTLASFALSLRLGGTEEAARTCALITLVMSQLIHVFECRSETRSIFRINPFGNMKLLLAAVISVGVLAAAVMVPQLQTVFETVIPEREQFLTALGLSAAVPVISGLFR